MHARYLDHIHIPVLPLTHLRSTPTTNSTQLPVLCWLLSIADQAKVLLLVYTWPSSGTWLTYQHRIDKEYFFSQRDIHMLISPQVWIKVLEPLPCQEWKVDWLVLVQVFCRQLLLLWIYKCRNPVTSKFSAQPLLLAFTIFPPFLMCSLSSRDLSLNTSVSLWLNNHSLSLLWYLFWVLHKTLTNAQRSISDDIWELHLSWWMYLQIQRAVRYDLH